jgi:hypothetical protein
VDPAATANAAIAAAARDVLVGVIKSFSQASQENADSRVYAGIHFRSACRDGITLGEQIGRRAFAQYLQAYRK